MARRKKRITNFEYDVCLSFAGEDRAYVNEVANSLTEKGVRVFYDEYEKVDLWGKDLYTYLDDIYRNLARYCVLFSSKNYAKKVWTNHERASAQARAFEENEEYILPARFDSTDIPGVRPTIGYIDLRTTSAEELARLITEKLGYHQQKEFFPPIPDLLFDYLEANDKDDQSVIYSQAINFFNILKRMSDDEKHVIFNFFLHGCPAELPDNIHINIDLLRRLTKFPVSKIKRIVGQIRSLGFYPLLRDADDTSHHFEPGQILVIEWYDLYSESTGNATEVVVAMIDAATNGYCEEHGLEALERLDFAQLASVTMREDIH